MCKSHYDSMHCKGQRKSHTKISIPLCGFCKYQVATKSCNSCFLIKHKPGTIHFHIPKHEVGMYCDTCFTHEHDKHEQRIEQDMAKKKNAVTILNRCKEAYLVQQRLHRKIDTSHRYEDLIQNCEECKWRSASWCCTDCKQVYCNKCLVGLHSMGGAFSRHKAELLPYYTPSMHASFHPLNTACGTDAA